MPPRNGFLSTVCIFVLFLRSDWQPVGDGRSGDRYCCIYNTYVQLLLLYVGGNGFVYLTSWRKNIRSNNITRPNQLVLMLNISTNMVPMCHDCSLISVDKFLNCARCELSCKNKAVWSWKHFLAFFMFLRHHVSIIEFIETVAEHRLLVCVIIHNTERGRFGEVWQVLCVKYVVSSSWKH
jgi:hypothetical protein